jgi:hypothetical protein
MKKINQTDYSRFRNNEHAQFHTVIRDEITAETPQKLGVIKFYQSYLDALALELTSIEVEQGSQHTKTIEDSDLYRDQLYRSFVLHIQSGLIDYEPGIKEAAKRIMRIVDQVGDMRKQPYNQESETLTSLINQLGNNYAADVALCNATVKLSKLDEANKSFVANFGTRATEASVRVSGDVRAARVVVDEVFKNICNVINAMVLLNGDADYSAFIDKLNYQVDYYTSTITIVR